MKTKALKQRIGRLLKKVRIEHCKSKAEIAFILEVSTQHYKSIEAGRKNLFLSQAIKLSKYYNVSLNIFC